MGFAPRRGGKYRGGGRRKGGNQNVVHDLPVPRNGEVIGVVVKTQGASNFGVMCNDGIERVCIIPGRLKRRFWLKEGDIVLVMPWTVKTAGGKDGGEIHWRYSIGDRERLQQRGLKIPT